MIWFALLAVGLVAGFIAGLLGIGGGILLVPAFMEIFVYLLAGAAVEQTAIGTSHTVIAVASIMAVATHRRYAKIDVALVARLFAGSLIGISLGTYLASIADGVTIRVLFGCVLLLVAYRTALGVRKGTKEVARQPSPWWIHTIAGTGIGTFSSFFGVGGGILLVPFLNNFAGMKAHNAMATSSAFIAVNASISTLMFILAGGGTESSVPMTLGFVHLGAALVGGGAAIVGARIGVRTARNIDGKRLLKWFALLLLLVASRLFYRAFFV